MKERLIEAEAFKKYCRRGYKNTERDFRSGTLRAFARQITEDFCRDIDEQPTVEAIPTEWIREQAQEYPGMESAMWDKLLRLWEKEKTKRELYGGEERQERQKNARQIRTMPVLRDQSAHRKRQIKGTQKQA